MDEWIISGRFGFTILYFTVVCIVQHKLFMHIFRNLAFFLHSNSFLTGTENTKKYITKIIHLEKCIGAEFLLESYLGLNLPIRVHP